MPPSGKRLALLCQHFYPEMISTGLHMTELATALTTRGWRIFVVCAPPQLDAGNTAIAAAMGTELPGIRIFRLPAIGSHGRGLFSRGLFAATFTAGTIWWLLRHRRSYDAVLVTTNPPFLGLAVALTRRITGKQYAFLVHDVYPDIAEALGAIRPASTLARLWRGITRVIASTAGRIIVIGRDMHDVIQRKLDSPAGERIRFIPNWSDESNVHPVPKRENRFLDEAGARGKFVVQYSGRLGRTHNLEPLVDAARLLADLPILVQIIGGGPKSAALQQRAAQAGATNVQFLGYQPYDRLDEVLSAADLAVVCLSEEFTGLSVPSKTYGILASGKPVLALLSKESEIGRLISETRCGIVLEHATPAEVEKAVQNLFDDRRVIDEMAGRARAVFLRDYTLAIAAERYDKCLEELVG